MGNKGRQYETELCARIYDETGGQLIAEPLGYSGNHQAPAPDIRIDDGQKIHAFELKKTSDDRKSIYYEPADKTTDDINQLLTYADTYPRTVVPYIGVRFTNRQLVVAPIWMRAPNDRAKLQSATNTAPSGVDISVTYADNLSVQRPDTDAWPSAQKGDDVAYILREIGYWDADQP